MFIIPVAGSIAVAQRLDNTETSQRWRAVGDIVFDLTGSEIEPKTFRNEDKGNITTVQEKGKKRINVMACRWKKNKQKKETIMQSWGNDVLSREVLIDFPQ